MIIFLYGPDQYRLKQNVDTVIAGYRAKHPSGFNIFSIQGSESGSLVSLRDALGRTSLFQEVKLVILNNPFHSNSAEGALGLLQEFGVQKDPLTVVLLVHSGTQKEANNKDLFSYANAAGNLIRKFDYLEGAELERWVKAEIKKRNLSIQTTAFRNLFSRVGKESIQWMQALDVLANYGGTITPVEVDRLIHAQQESNIFEFVDAVALKDRPKAFSLLYRELALGRDPYYILSMIAYQLRTMLMVGDSTARGLPAPLIAKKTGLHPFVIKKMSNAITRYKVEDLKLAFSRLSDLDLGAKSGNLDLQDALFSLVLA
ncbi:DNA polymerase III subunit delta [Candidatus Parcubacteria bacterium]|nr:DNA polymerase III subunit delta [Candidatus Parcubacteria bacterium]